MLYNKERDMVHLFKEGFTPLFKVSISNEVFKQDLLDIKYCWAARGEKGHCFSRSRHFLHDSNRFSGIRLIFNREKLSQRYRIYPVDEVCLAKVKDAKKGWYIGSKITYHKAAFPLKKNTEGEVLRQPRHGLKSIDFNKCCVEQEFEERIPKNIFNLGRYIYAINYWSDKDIYKNDTIKKYLEKYPHIKVLSGYDKFEDKTDYFFNQHSLLDRSVIYT